MEKIKNRSIIYFTLTCIISLTSIVSVQYVEKAFMLKFFAILCLSIIGTTSYFNISLGGDKIIKQSNPELYEEFNKLNESFFPFKHITPFISSELLLTRRFKHYPHLRLLKIATVIYFLSCFSAILAILVIISL